MMGADLLYFGFFLPNVKRVASFGCMAEPDDRYPPEEWQQRSSNVTELYLRNGFFSARGLQPMLHMSPKLEIFDFRAGDIYRGPTLVLDPNTGLPIDTSDVYQSIGQVLMLVKQTLKRLVINLCTTPWYNLTDDSPNVAYIGPLDEYTSLEYLSVSWACLATRVDDIVSIDWPKLIPMSLKTLRIQGLAEWDFPETAERINCLDELVTLKHRNKPLCLELLQLDEVRDWPSDEQRAVAASCGLTIQETSTFESTQPIIQCWDGSRVVESFDFSFPLDRLDSITLQLWRNA